VKLRISISKTYDITALKLVILGLLCPFFIQLTQAAFPLRCDQILQPSSQALEKLQQEQSLNKSFAVQGEIDRLLNKGGSCGLVCAINLIQGLKVSLGFHPQKNVQEMAQHLIQEIPLVANGGMTLSSLHSTLNFLLKSYVPHLSFDIHTTQLKLKETIENPHTTFGKITLNKIRPKPNEFKIALIWTPAIGGHYVLIKSVQQNQVSVIEPNHPERLSEFTTTSFIIEDQNNIEAMGWIPQEGNILKFSNDIYYVVLSVTSVKMSAKPIRPESDLHF